MKKDNTTGYLIVLSGIVSIIVIFISAFSRAYAFYTSYYTTAGWTVVGSDPFTMFEPGPDFRNDMINIAGSTGNIMALVRSNTSAYGAGVSNYILVNTDNSVVPIQMWFNSSQLAVYYYSPSNTIYLNPDSSEMFSNMTMGGAHLSNIIRIHTPGWNTKYVTNMAGMFSWLSNLTYGNNPSIGVDISDWDTSNVTDMSNMFGNSGYSNIYNINAHDSIYIGNWNTSKVVNMANMFRSSRFENLDLGNWDTRAVKNMDSLFTGAGYLRNLNVINWNTHNVTNVSNMFYGTTNLDTLDISNFNLINITNYAQMFHNTSFPSWGIINLKTPQNIKGGINIPLPTFYSRNESNRLINYDWYYNLNVYNPTQTWMNTYALFKPGNDFKTDLNGYAGLNIVAVERSSNTPMSYTTRNDSNSPVPIYWWFDTTTNTAYYYSKSNVIYLNPDSSNMFSGLYNLTSINMTGWNSSHVTNMSRIFMGIKAPLSISNWDVSNVTNLKSAFLSYGYPGNLDIIGWNTGKVNDFSTLFQSGGAFNYNLSGWNTSKADNMSYLFGFATNMLNANLDGWTFNNVTNMYGMFTYDSNLRSLNTGSWNTGKVNDMATLFSYVQNLQTLDVSNWNTSNVTTMSQTFSYVGVPDLNVSNWNTYKVTNMYGMFMGYKNYNSNVSMWDTRNLNNAAYMFSNMTYASTSDRFMNLYNWNLNKLDNGLGMFNTNVLTPIRNFYTPACIALNPITYYVQLQYMYWNNNIDMIPYYSMFGGAGTPMPHVVINLIEPRVEFNAGSVIQSALNNIRNNMGSGNSFKNLVYCNNLSSCGTNRVDQVYANTTSSHPYYIYLYRRDNTSAANNIYYFTTLPPDYVYLNTNASNMFRNFVTLNNIQYMGNWNTSKVTNISYMFTGSLSKNSTINMKSWNLANVTSAVDFIMFAANPPKYIISPAYIPSSIHIPLNVSYTYSGNSYSELNSTTPAKKQYTRP